MKAPETKGFTLIEVLVVVAIIGVLAAMVISQLLRARMATNEASAIGSLRAINTAQETYAQKCHGYAPVLTELKLAGNYLSPDLTSAANVIKSGYTMTVGVSRAGGPVAPAAAGGTPPTSSAFTPPPLLVAVTPRRALLANKAGSAFFYDNRIRPPIRSYRRPPRFINQWRPAPTDETRRRGRVQLRVNRNVGMWRARPELNRRPPA